MALRLAAALFVLASAAAAPQYTTPVPILKHINRQNEDGSYSYGYENADGSYKIETKHPTGEVFGKYGYVDDTGKRREIEYGASRRGFEPAGTDINVPPPTLTNSNSPYRGPDDYDDGQYREDPSVYWKDQSFNSRPQHRFQSAPAPAPAPAPVQPQYNPPAPQQNYYNPPPQQQPRYYNPPNYNFDPNIFRGHPASNFNPATGSYSVSYSG